jgi:hypothetical protein
MISPQRHPDHGEKPSASRDMAWLRPCVFCASVARIRAKQSQLAARGAGKTIATAGGLDAATRHTRQARQTKPIHAGAPRRASPLSAKSYGKLYMQRAAAKQSQFRAVGSGTRRRGYGPGGRLCKTNPIWPAPRGRGERNAQNEPNSCETKPIPRPGRYLPLFQYSIIPIFHHSNVLPFLSTWTRGVDCANNGGLDGIRSFSEAGQRREPCRKPM